MKNQSSYSERIVGFIDILGFKDIVSKLEHNPNLHKQVLYALNKMKEYKKYSTSKKTSLYKLEISVFSDSIAISSKANSIFDVFGRVDGSSRTCYMPEFWSEAVFP